MVLPSFSYELNEIKPRRKEARLLLLSLRASRKSFITLVEEDRAILDDQLVDSMFPREAGYANAGCG